MMGEGPEGCAEAPGPCSTSAKLVPVGWRGEGGGILSERFWGAEQPAPWSGGAPRQARV